MMTSPIHSENDSFDSVYLKASRSYSEYSGGVLLLEEADRAPEYLRLTIDSDIEEEENQVFENDADSEEDVVLLGEKHPTYQEITLEEDEEGEIKESVIEKEKAKSCAVEIKESIFECPSCDKSFRIESLLKFHIQMHSSVVCSAVSSTSDSSSSKPVENHKQKLSKHKNKRHSSEKEDTKSSRNLKISHKHKTHRNRHKSHKKSKHKRSEHF